MGLGTVFLTVSKIQKSQSLKLKPIRHYALKNSITCIFGCTTQLYSRLHNNYLDELHKCINGLARCSC